MRNLILLIIGSFVFIGCANLDVARQAYIQGDYNTSIAIYKAWAKRGFPEAQLKLAQMANSGIIKASPKFIIQNALAAYKKGYTKAANLLFYNYYKIGDIKNARIWLDRVEFASMNQKIFEAYLQFVQIYIQDTSLQQHYIQRLTTYALSSKNTKALYALAKFYEESTFIDLQKSEYYYSLAYKNGFIPAGVRLGLLYIYKLHLPKKGIALLKKVANKDNGTSAYNIALFLLQKMRQELQKLNTPCISFYFNTPKEFFTKKIEVKLFQKEFLHKNVAPWLEYAYKRGYVGGKLKLISLDLQMRDFNKTDNLSHLSLSEAIAYLEQLDLFKAKLILARIYESYPNLHQLMRAKMIYEEYVNRNKIDAYWHLYQFYKRFYPKSKQKDFYLDFLVAHDFTPAIIEKAYFDLLGHKEREKNLHILRFYAQQNNILALTYLASIYAIYDKKEKNKQTLLKLCHLTSPINPSLDLKIAKYYLKEKNITKSATIYYYYAQQKSASAAYMLSRIYKALGECKKNIHWLRIAKEEGSKKAELTYAKWILKGLVDGNLSKAVSIVEQYAMHNDPVSLTLLGDIYKQGIAVPFDPKKAKKYYKMAIALGYERAYLNLIALYKLLNPHGQYNEKILQLYSKLLTKTNSDDIRLQIAQFFFDQKKFQKAKEIIKKYRLYRYDEGKYLYYQLTGNTRYLGKKTVTSNPKLLLLYAKLLQNKNRKKALYYGFLAAFANANGSSEFILRQLKFFPPSTIRQIYKRAKRKYKQQQQYSILQRGQSL